MEVEVLAMTLEFQYRSHKYVIPLKHKLTYIQGNSTLRKSTLRDFVNNPITYVNVPCDLVTYSQLSDMLRISHELRRDTVVIIDESEAEYIRRSPKVLEEARNYFNFKSKYKLYWIVMSRVILLLGPVEPTTCSFDSQFEANTSKFAEMFKAPACNTDSFRISTQEATELLKTATSAATRLFESASYDIAESITNDNQTTLVSVSNQHLQK